MQPFTHPATNQPPRKYRALQKNALIENRFKTQIKKLNWTESWVFLIMDNHCDKGNTYLFLVGTFMDVLKVFHKYFENNSVLCFQGVTWFFVKKGLLLCTDVISVTHANLIGEKGPRNTLGTFITYPRITLKDSWNNHEVSLKHPWNTPKHPWNTPRNTQVNINIYFPRNNDGPF